MQGQGNHSTPQGQFTSAPSLQQYGSLPPPPPPPPISQGAQQGWPQAGHLIPLDRPYVNSNPPSQMQQHSHWSPMGLPPPPMQLFGKPPPPYNNTAMFYASSPVGSSDLLSSSAATRLPPPPPPPHLHSSSHEGPQIPPSSSPSNFNTGISDGGTQPNVLPPAPPKPADDKIVRTIELLCQFIAKNGPEFENMTRLKQRENPDFRFLFGAEPGSEAAIAHEYYRWTRRKYQLECSSVAKLGTSNSPLRRSGGSSSHHSSTTDQGLCSSPAGSDIDMEDDITHPLEEPRSFSSEKQDRETVSSSTGLEKKEEFQPCAEAGIPKDGVDQSNLQHSKPGSRGHREGKPSAEVDGLGSYSSGDDELPVSVSKTASIDEVLGKPCAPAEIRLETVPNLLPGYESDRSSGGGDQPKSSVPYVGVGSSSHHMDESVGLGRGCETERVAALDKGHEYPAKSFKLSSIVVAAGKDFIARESENVAENPGFPKDGIPDDGKKKDPNDVSSSLKVDEFGRLVRENDSGSDHDSPRHRRQKRGRSRSRSRSPQDRRRRRSPRRRNERRSRSHSFSPKRRRSWSKSPPSTRHVVKTKQRGICHHIANGKHCYRGSSCKYLHSKHEIDRSSPRLRGRQQFPDSPRTSGAHKRSEMSYKKSSSEGKYLDSKRYDDSPITEGASVHIPEEGGDLELSVYLYDGDQQHKEVEIPSSFTRQLPKDETNLNDEPKNKTDESGNVSEEHVVYKESVLPVLDHPPSMMPPFFPNLAATYSHYQAGYPHSQFSFAPNQPWNSLPPPPPVSYPPRPVPPHGGATGQLALNMIPRNDPYPQNSARPLVTEFPHSSNVGQSQGYHYLQDPNRSSGNFDDHQQKTSFASEPVMGQSHVPGMPTPSSFGEGSSLSHNQPMPFLGDSVSKRQSYPAEVPPLAGGNYAPQGEQNSSLPVHSSGFDWNQPSMLSNLGVSQIPNHFNPYASTFEQPPSSKLGATGLSEIHVEGRALPDHSSVQATEGVLPQRGGDQYDPLSDSMEPSLNIAGKSHYGHEITDESDGMLRFGGEEAMQKMGGAPELSVSFENDEFGETADAEVGAVENGSPNNELQVNYPGKSKESRSMRLFKIAIANFVKEVLKPSWRQGNMSKEAFKTIVKKTVDRVSGAMKDHQIPKSQSKINHYIDSSQRKLTKLVMGYVDKYVKV